MVKPSLQRGIVMQRAPDHAQPVNMNHGAVSHVADKTLATLAVFAKSARLQPTNPCRLCQALV
jgi:hypothetical protein